MLVSDGTDLAKQVNIKKTEGFSKVGRISITNGGQVVPCDDLNIAAEMSSDAIQLKWHLNYQPHNTKDAKLPEMLKDCCETAAKLCSLSEKTVPSIDLDHPEQTGTVVKGNILSVWKNENQETLKLSQPCTPYQYEITIGNLHSHDNVDINLNNQSCHGFVYDYDSYHALYYWFVLQRLLVFFGYKDLLQLTVIDTINDPSGKLKLHHEWISYQKLELSSGSDFAKLNNVFGTPSEYITEMKQIGLKISSRSTLFTADIEASDACCLFY